MKKLSALQVAEIFEVSENTVKKLAKNGDLPCTYINKQAQFCIDELKTYFELLERGCA